MNKKYVIFGGKKELSKEQISEIQKDSQRHLMNASSIQDIDAAEKLLEEDYLVHVDGRIIVKTDIENKNFHTFQDGTRIRRERLYNEFNRRIAQPVNCIVISGEGIPKNAELLVDHNAFHETNRINDYKNSFENEGSDRVRYFSIPYYEAFCWRENGCEWNALYPYEFALRVFKPYEGNLVGIDPEKIKNTLYVLSGELKGNIVRTLVGCDYEIIFQESNGREGSLIVFRPFGEEKRKMEEEAVAILNDHNEKLLRGELLIGFQIKDAKPLNESINV